MATTQDHGPRRELKSRNTGWARIAARWACASGLSPNAISVLSILFAAGSMTCFLYVPDCTCTTGSALLWFGAAAGIQLRLLCNLMDGMVAVEGGKATATGPIYNEVPDRVADVMILVGAGYSTRMDPGVIKLLDTLPLGWSCAIMAMATAYVRLLQGTLTGQQSFMGPMAKQHRMAVLTLGCFVALGESLAGREPVAVYWALLVILIGACWTFIRRLMLISTTLKARK